MTVTMAWNNSNYEHMFHSWEGPTGIYIARRATKLQTQATMQAGLRTGALKAAMGTYFGTRDKELEAKIGVNPGQGDGDSGYARMHHEGTAAHIIRPSGKALKFKQAGATVFYSKVNHPGTDANPYLTMFLREAVE